MSQKIFTFDSQMLNTFQACERKYQYSFIDQVAPEEKAEALERGDLMHRMLEVYYSLQLKDGFKYNDTWNTLVSAGITPSIDKSFISIQKFAIQAGQYFGTILSLDSDEIDGTIFQFKEYSSHFQNDSWNPLAVEEVGSKVLFENDEYKIIYNFKIDLIAEKGNIICPWDHKTAKRREAPSSLSNQFIGYCFGLDTNNIIVNKIGFQKTLTPEQRFNRYILTIDDERIQEWRENTLEWAFRMMEANEREKYPLNLTSCDKYSGCIFAPICESPISSREWKIERDFKVGNKWDVAEILEAK